MSIFEFSNSEFSNSRERVFDAADGFFLAEYVGDIPDMRTACGANETDTEGIHHDADAVLLCSDPRHDDVIQVPTDNGVAVIVLGLVRAVPVHLADGFEQREHLGHMARRVFFPALLERLLVILGGGYKEEIGLLPQFGHEVNAILCQTDDFGYHRFVI